MYKYEYIYNNDKKIKGVLFDRGIMVFFYLESFVMFFF